jgi:hypothetical protein
MVVIGNALLSEVFDGVNIPKVNKLKQQNYEFDSKIVFGRFIVKRK